MDKPEPPARPLSPMKKVRDELAGAEVGMSVCISGYGVANGKHVHAKIVGITKLYIKTEYTIKRWNTGEKLPVQCRFRRDDGQEVPRQEYSGATIRLTCQRRSKPS